MWLLFVQEDWDEREKIPDPTATKPDDWDESQPATIPDLDAMKPEGWLDEESKLVPDPDAVKPTDWCATQSFNSFRGKYYLKHITVLLL